MFIVLRGYVIHVWATPRPIGRAGEVPRFVFARPANKHATYSNGPLDDVTND